MLVITPPMLGLLPVNAHTHIQDLMLIQFSIAGVVFFLFWRMQLSGH